MTSAVDTGIAVNPDTIVAQLQGGLIFGLTAALFGEITIEQRPRASIELQRLSHAAHRRSAARSRFTSSKAAKSRAASARPASPPGRRRLRNAIYAATGVALRRLPIDRKALAVGEQGVSVMRTRGTILVIVVLLIVAAVVCLEVFNPGPLAFAGGSTVALADYHAADPTGVPADLAKCRRGKARRISGARRRLHGLPYRVARPAYAGGLRLRPAIRHALFDQYHARQRNRDRQLQRSGFPQCRAARHTAGRHASLPGDAVSVLHPHDRRGCSGDQGLFVQPAGGACAQIGRTRLVFHTISAG